MILKTSLVIALLAGLLCTGCSGGADEGNYTGPTEKFPNSNNQAPPSQKKGGTELKAEP